MTDDTIGRAMTSLSVAAARRKDHRNGDLSGLQTDKTQVWGLPMNPASILWPEFNDWILIVGEAEKTDTRVTYPYPENCPRPEPQRKENDHE